MVSKFEQFVGGYAKELEENGHPAKAEVLRALVKSHREDGVPEVFPDRASQSSPEERPSEQLADIRLIRAKIVESLSKVSSTQDEGLAQELFEKVARAINENVGQLIPDEREVRNLHPGGKVSAYINEGWEGFRQVDVRVRRVYNVCMGQLARAHYSVGEIRNATSEEIMRSGSRSVSERAARFSKTAFARPQQPEG